MVRSCERLERRLERQERWQREEAEAREADHAFEVELVHSEAEVKGKEVAALRRVSDAMVRDAAMRGRSSLVTSDVSLITNH